ncbi:hypothetical protein HPB52_018868 [Rhipicephalus sanguineus]|uniref:Uncharacterized protein n=1 Tax=Rhipicephalus sanguineus TaxID=34632 RepID=A0A9D4QGN5_RHISA|nr:hypothetical protein HPB52_018868 [Rhipicephalus sanguineus]
MEVTAGVSVLLSSITNPARANTAGAACEWTAGETKLMLDYYEQYFAQKSGNSPSDVPYDEELAKIAAQDDSLEPEELRDGHGVVWRKDTGSMSSRKGRLSGEVEETPDEEMQSSQSSQSTSSNCKT